MRFDPELALWILGRMEEACDGNDPGQWPFDGADSDRVMYHLFQLKMDGLIIGIDLSSASGRNFAPLDLTPAGHRFLALAREDTLWKKAIEAAKAGGTIAVGALWSAMTSDLLRRIGMGP